MNEHFTRNYLREEEFLDEFYEMAGKAVRLLNGQWCPDEDCNDAVRKDRQYFLSANSLPNLVFDSASLHSDAHGLSLVKIILRSSRRLVVVAVKRVGKEFVAEKISDRVQGEGG